MEARLAHKAHSLDSFFCVGLHPPQPLGLGGLPQCEMVALSNNCSLPSCCQLILHRCSASLARSRSCGCVLFIACAFVC